jgi:hypothetical protein
LKPAVKKPVALKKMRSSMAGDDAKSVVSAVDKSVKKKPNKLVSTLSKPTPVKEVPLVIP